MRDFTHPTTDSIDLCQVLFALSDPIRLSIVKALAAEGEQVCNVFTGPFSPREGISKSALTHHFKVLRDAGLISTRTEGTRRINSLRFADLERRFPGLLPAILHAAETSSDDTPAAA